MEELFIAKNFRSKALDIIHKANRVIGQFQARGFKLTLRQLYYQFVAHDLFPDKYVWTAKGWRKPQPGQLGTINAEPNYDLLGVVISDGRLAGMIDWDAIEDRTRFLRGHTTYANPSEAIQALHRRYRIDMWQGQDTRLEVWIEKDALIGVVEGVCSKWDIDHFACKGYASQSELYNAGVRIRERRADTGQNTVVIHLGDHDPSGMDMTRDNCDRLSLFAGDYVEVRRIALNMPQVEQYEPPPNPTKMTDSRAEGYVQEFGEECWELDALSPEVIAELIQQEVNSTVDFDLWNERVEQWKADRVKLMDASNYVTKNKDE
jgi:hypothetical protein